VIEDDLLAAEIQVAVSALGDGSHREGEPFNAVMLVPVSSARLF
jgi:hypothetical protein